MAAIESLILDGLELITAPFSVEEIDFGLPASLAEWVKGADSDGAILGRPPLYENRVITVRIQIRQQATMNAVLGHVATIEDKLLECAQNANGLALTWDPAESTLGPITFRCLLGEVVDFPLDHLYWAKAPVFGIKMTCLPFGEGAEYLAGSVTSADPMQVLTLTAVKGDVLGLGRLVVTDNASQSRRWVAWGLESRWLPTSSAPALIVDSASMVTTGFAGVTDTRSGAYSGATDNVIRATLRTQVQAICGLGNLSHVGDFRPQLRFYASATTMNVRLTWQALDGPFRSLSYNVPAVVGWNHVDLGLLTIPKVALGTQKWTGRIEAYSTKTGGEVLDVDALWLVPAAAFGRARATFARAAPVVSAFDEFTGTTSGGTLNTRTAPVGGTWATSGATTDFAFSDIGGERVQRSTISDTAMRYALLGTTTYTNTEASVEIEVDSSDGAPELWIIARHTDASNLLRAKLDYFDRRLSVDVIVAGTTTELAAAFVSLQYQTRYVLRIAAYATGQVTAQLTDAAGAVKSTLNGYHASLATGGALASGKFGFADRDNQSTESIRYYDTFYGSTPAAEAIACYSGQSIEFRHDSTLREDSSGTYAGPPPEYVGGRFTVPPAGGPGRHARIGVIARRNDVETSADDFIADSTTVEAYVTPRYLVVPRA